MRRISNRIIALCGGLLISDPLFLIKDGEDMFEKKKKKDRRSGEDRRRLRENVPDEKRKSDRRKADRRDPKNAYKA